MFATAGVNRATLEKKQQTRDNLVTANPEAKVGDEPHEVRSVTEQLIEGPLRPLEHDKLLKASEFPIGALDDLIREGCTLEEALNLLRFHRERYDRERQVDHHARELALRRREVEAQEGALELQKQDRVRAIRRLPFQDQINSWNRSDFYRRENGKLSHENMVAVAGAAKREGKQRELVEWMRNIQLVIPYEIEDNRYGKYPDESNLWAHVVSLLDLPLKTKSWQEAIDHFPKQSPAT